MATAVKIVVNGLSGPRCTLDASTEWTIQQVKEAIQVKIGVSVDWQRLLKGTQTLFWEATISSLISEDHAETLELTLLVEAPRPVDFAGMCNGLVQVEPGHLQKAGGAYSHNATAVSPESLVVGQGRGLRFRPGTTDKGFLIGLKSGSSTPGFPQGMDYAACCGGDGLLHIFESSELTFSGPAFSQRTLIDLLVSRDRVEFLMDGDLVHTSPLRGEGELFAMASFFHVGAEALEIQWL